MSNQKPVSPEIVELAGKIKPTLAITDDVIAIPKDTYEKHLPEGVTIETVKTIQAHRGQFMAAMQLAAGEIIHDTNHFKDHKDVAAVSGEYPMGNDDGSFTVHRVRRVPVALGSTEMKDIHGDSSSKLLASNGSGIKAVQAHLRSVFSESNK